MRYIKQTKKLERLHNNETGMEEVVDKVKIGQLIWVYKKVHPVILLLIKITQISSGLPIVLIQKKLLLIVSQQKLIIFLNRLQPVHRCIKPSC